MKEGGKTPSFLFKFFLKFLGSNLMLQAREAQGIKN
jgi:hypothetical protein